MSHPAPIVRLALTLLAAEFGANLCAADNFLLNPGAEQGRGEQPSVWFTARVPADELKMRRASQGAAEGGWSLAIENQHQYERPTSNNWGQHVQDDLQGKVVRLHALIHTEDADAANVCVQCWDVRGETLLAFASTAVFRGDQPWIEAASQPLNIPQGARRIVVRAALSGKGKAWFDNIRLVPLDSEMNGAERGAQGDKAESDAEAAEARASSKRGQRSLAGELSLDADLVRLVGARKGRVIESYPIVKDCMVLSYMPRWKHGQVDNIAVADNSGGVRTLLQWTAVPKSMAQNSEHRFYLAIYSRKTTAQPSASDLKIEALADDWPESTSWLTQPSIVDIAAPFTKSFDAGDGWKLFDVTAHVRRVTQTPNSGHGVRIRFAREQPSNVVGKPWSGYTFASRHGIGQWSDRHPVLLAVEPAPASNATD